jgi:hypothetical protein
MTLLLLLACGPDPLDGADLTSSTVTGDALAAGAVTGDALAPEAVDAAALALDAVRSEHVLDGTLRNQDVAPASLEGSALAEGAVGTRELGYGAVTSDHVANAAVLRQHVEDQAIGGDQIADGAVQSQHLADGALTAVALDDGAIVARHISDGVIDAYHLAPGSLLTEHFSAGAVTADVLASGSVGRTQIASDAVRASHIEADAVGEDEIGTDAVDSDELDDTISLGSSSGAAGGLWLYDGGADAVVKLNATSVGVGYLKGYFPSGDTATTMTSSSSSGEGFIGVGDDGGGCCDAGLYVDTDGNGIVFGDTKNFVVEHPDDPELRIVYASLEGPEAGAYVRGTALIQDGYAWVDLPEHFGLIAAPEGMTAQLTVTSLDTVGVAVTELTPDHLVIEERMGGAGTFEVHWRVEAVRLGHQDYEVVRPASDFAPVQGPDSTPRDL